MDVNHTFFGRAEYDLARRDETWLIARKKTILENDRIPLPIDIYCLAVNAAPRQGEDVAFKTRRIVTGFDAAGRSVVTSDTVVEFHAGPVR